MPPCRFLVLALWFTWQSTCRHQHPHEHIRQPFPLLLSTAPTDYGRRMARASTWLLRAEAGSGWTAELSPPAQEALQLCGASPDLPGGRLRYARIGKSQNGNGELRQESTPLLSFSLHSVVSGGSRIIGSLCVWWINGCFKSMFCFSLPLLCVLWKHYYKWLMFI